MIKFALRCARDHEFEGWFASGAEFDKQAKRKLIECPACGDAGVEKAIMAPAVVSSRGASGSQQVVATAPEGGAPEFEELTAKLRAHVEKNFDYVGENFPEEARKIHYGEAEERGIYGEASGPQVKALAEEGVKVAALPGVKKPRARMN